MKVACFGFFILVALVQGTSFGQQAKESPQPGRYQIVNTKTTVIEMPILVDTWTGKTWKLGVPAGSGATAWIPISRLDTAKQMDEWVKTHPPLPTPKK